MIKILSQNSIFSRLFQSWLGEKDQYWVYWKIQFVFIFKALKMKLLGEPSRTSEWCRSPLSWKEPQSDAFLWSKTPFLCTYPSNFYRIFYSMLCIDCIWILFAYKTSLSKLSKQNDLFFFVCAFGKQKKNFFYLHISMKNDFGLIW